MQEGQQTATESSTNDQFGPDWSFRATPEELTAAILAIERRNASDAERLAKTVSVGQAVHELRIDATPAEVVAEIRYQRKSQIELTVAKQRVSVVVPPIPAHKELQLFLGFIALLIAMCWFSASLVPSGQDSSTLQATPQPIISTPITVPAQSSSPVIETLASVPTNHPVTCDTPNLKTLIHTGNQHSVRVTDGGPVDASTWILVKMNGHTYVRGFFLARIMQDALDIGTVTLHSDQNSAKTQVLLRTDRMHFVYATRINDSIGGIDSQVTLSGVRLDDHAYESW